MSETTQIHPDKVRAYLVGLQARSYHSRHRLNIGQRSDRMAVLFAERGVSCWDFLSSVRSF
jgi:hypothetical protein